MSTYTTTDRTLHRLSQILAKAGRSFVPAREDDSHTNFYFDPMSSRLLTQSLGETGRRLAFNLYNSTFEWVDARTHTTLIIKLAGQTYEQLENIIAGQLLATQLDDKDYRRPLHYDFPAYDDLPKTYTAFPDDAVTEWCHYRRMANQAATALLGYLNAEGQPRIWPHHFDTGVYAVVANDVGIGFGLAMNDDLVKTPYFYLAGYPQNGTFDYSQAPSLTQGEWHETNGYKGAVLPINALPGQGSMKMVMKFAREAVEAYLAPSQK